MLAVLYRERSTVCFMVLYCVSVCMCMTKLAEEKLNTPLEFHNGGLINLQDIARGATYKP